MRFCHGSTARQHLHRSETTGIAERAVRRAKEGASAVLPQSGLDEKWWSDSVECYCYLRNVQNLLADGESNGGILIADMEDLETLDAQDVYSRRVKAKEVLISQKDEFHVPKEETFPFPLKCDLLGSQE